MKMQKCYVSHSFIGAEMLGRKGEKHVAPILGFLQSRHKNLAGRIVVYGDSNCIDNSHLSKGIYLFHLSIHDIIWKYFHLKMNLSLDSYLNNYYLF